MELSASELTKDGWELVEFNHQLGIGTYRKDMGDGTAIEAKGYHLDQQLFDHNATMRAETAGTKWGEGTLVGRIPLNIFFDPKIGLHQATVEGDDTFVNRWLSNSENMKFRTKEGNL